MSAPSLAEVLRSRGLRLTPQRQAILDAVRSLGHGTPEQVFAQVRDSRDSPPAVNITTVYRTLELLEELGLVAHSHLSHGAPNYHPAEERGHVHLVCHRCGAVLEEPLGTLRDLADTLLARRGFALDVGHVALFGLCQECTDD